MTLTGTLSFDTSLIERSQLDVVQQLLADLAPQWATRLRLVSRGQTTTLTDADKLADATAAVAFERGPTYQQLVKLHGRGRYERTTGTVELHGRTRSPVVYINLDEWNVKPLANELHFGNWMYFEISGESVEGQAAHAWLERVFCAFGTSMNLAHGFAHVEDEYEKKNRDPHTELIVGRDIAKWLPGLYWLNCFGEPYVELIGKNQLLSAPAHRVEEAGDTILMWLSAEPSEWASASYRETETRVLDHLGQDYFFSSTRPTHGQMAPDWPRPWDGM